MRASTSSTRVWIGTAALMVVLAMLGGIGLRAETIGRAVVERDSGAQAIVQRLEANAAGARVEVLATLKETSVVTGYAYTRMKARVGTRDVLATLNETTGTFSLDGELLLREERTLLAGLPMVYSKMSPDLLGLVRHVQGGRLGAEIVQAATLDIDFYASSTAGLDAIQDELGSVPGERFDGEALWKERPPILHPRRDGSVPTPPPVPEIFTLSARVSVAELLRVGASDAVVRIEPQLLSRPTLGNSVRRIKGNIIKGYGLVGTEANVGIVDTGIDSGHSDLPLPLAEQVFNSVKACDGGSRQDHPCASDCQGGACQVATGKCVGGVDAGLACCPGAHCTANACDGGYRQGLPCASACPGGQCEVTTGACIGGPDAGRSCCPGAICEDPWGDTAGHGTHVAGIVRNSSILNPGMATSADLINAKAVPGTAAQTAAAYVFARGLGADVINASLGAVGGCNGLCTAPPARSGSACATDSGCDQPAGSNNGICNSGARCVVHSDCDVPPGVGLCISPTTNGQNAWTRDVDFEVYSSNITFAIAAMERPYTGHCSNAAATLCTGDDVCVNGGHCIAFPTVPNDSYNGITVGSSDVTHTSATVSWFSARGPTSNFRSKPDVIAPGEASPSGRCFGGTLHGIPCNDVLDDTDCKLPAPGTVAGNCTAATCVGLCTGATWKEGAYCSNDRDCDHDAVTQDGVCAPGQNFGAPCTNEKTGSECIGGACAAIPDPDGIDSCAADWEGKSYGVCTTSGDAAHYGPECFVSADCGGGTCTTFPGNRPPNTQNDEFVDNEGTSMAAPHVTGLVAQLWDFGNTGPEKTLTDTPYLKATILNTANRLEGWKRPAHSQPLDVAQGTGEIDALEAFHAYADDLRVWQQNVGQQQDHWYWTDLSAGDTAAFTLVFERHETNPASSNFTPLNDLDLLLFGQGGVELEYSNSPVDSVEHIVYPVVQSGRYCIDVHTSPLGQGNGELYALAGSPRRLNFTGTVFPCLPDFGDVRETHAPGLPHYPTLLADEGARHLDWTKEWLGASRQPIGGELRKGSLAVVSTVDPFPSVTGERDAVDPFDQDGHGNLEDSDGFDDGVEVPPHNAWDTATNMTVTVAATVDDTGYGPLGRYQLFDPRKRLYLNAWMDWNGNGSWGDPGEQIIEGFAIDPETWGMNGRYTIGENYSDVNHSGFREPNEPYTDFAGQTSRTYQFTVTPPSPENIVPILHARFRLDYGENAGILANVSGNLSKWQGEAQFGEVEDYTYLCGDLGEVPHLDEPARNVLTWASVPGASVTYDVLRGTGASLPVGSVPGAEVCRYQYISSTTAFDIPNPPLGTFFWYLVRARAACGAPGSWGTQSNGQEETSETCASCKSSGSTCTATSQCCTGSCIGGVCQPGCTANGGSCISPVDCCGGTCQGGTCCAPQGSACGGNSECCAGFCSGGFCVAGCVPDGGTCAASGQCCSGSCQQGNCCGAPASPCASNGQCCSGACDNGSCRGACLPNGYDCSFGTCCSGNCPGSTCCGAPGALCNGNLECCFGTCNNGQCESSCLDNLIPCATSSQCCSEICLGGFCRACTPGSAACSTDEQCCSHYCLGGFCEP